MQDQNAGRKPAFPRVEIRARKIRLASRESGLKFLSSGMSTPRRLDLLVGRIDGRELARGDADGLGGHAPRDQHVGMVLGDELMILSSQLGVRQLGRGEEDVVWVVQAASDNAGP